MREQFTRYYRDHYPQVLAFCRRRTVSDASGQIAEDLTAETFARAWRGMDKLADQTNPLPWLYGIARNVVGEYYRSQQRHPEHSAVHMEQGHNSAALTDSLAAADETSAIDLSLDIGKALSRLPGDDRELLMLTAWEGLSPKEVAEVLGIAPTAARVRIHRARARLTKALEGVQA